MEKKEYPIKGKSGYGVMAAEPIEAVAFVDTAVAKGIEDDRETVVSFAPPFLGPATQEEALARIEETEQEIEQGEIYAWKDVLNEARMKVSMYAAEVY